MSRIVHLLLSTTGSIEEHNKKKKMHYLMKSDYSFGLWRLS